MKCEQTWPCVLKKTNISNVPTNKTIWRLYFIACVSTKLVAVHLQIVLFEIDSNSHGLMALFPHKRWVKCHSHAEYEGMCTAMLLHPYRYRHSFISSSASFLIIRKRFLSHFVIQWKKLALLFLQNFPTLKATLSHADKLNYKFGARTRTWF